MSEPFDDFGDLTDDDVILASDEPETWTLNELHASRDLGAIGSDFSHSDDRLF